MARDLVDWLPFAFLGGVLLTLGVASDVRDSNREHKLAHKELKVSESYINLTYGGMPSQDSFCLVENEGGEMNRRTKPLYFPADSKRISISGVDYNIISVSPDKIDLSIIRSDGSRE